MISLFEAHNARFSDLKTIGATFVLRKNSFDLICKGRNTLVLGPRGSGKTTLLKMIKIGAQIAASSSQENFKALKGIDYYPVYLNADRQFELLTDGIDFEKNTTAEHLKPIAKTLTAIRTQFSLLDTFEEMADPRTENCPTVSHLYNPVSREEEYEFCKILELAWNLREDIGTLKELRAHLSGRIDNINTAVYGYSIFPDKPELLLKISDYFTDPISVTNSFVKSFDSIFPKKSKRWCLCIDELEIMPDELQKYFFLNLRSTDTSVLLKVATSPFTSAFSEFYRPSATTPSDGHDYDPVNLSESQKKDSVRFTRKLVGELIKREGLPGSTQPKTILGTAPVTEESDKAPYASPNGAHYKRFKDLAAKDSHFNGYLRKHGIDLKQVGALTEDRRAANIRQAIWQVALRLEYGSHQLFTTKHGTKQRSTSKKSLSHMYTGADSLLTMCEGNPRITIGLFSVLISEYINSGKQVIPRPKQAELLEITIVKYLSLLSAIPLKFSKRKKSIGSIVTLLEMIGDYCEEDNLKGEFKPESLSTFRVNDEIDPKTIDALGNAINQGAFIMIEDKDKRRTYGDLRGARLRLSYLLCPRYKLPLTYGRVVGLNKILNSKSGEESSSTLRIRDLFVDGN